MARVAYPFDRAAPGTEDPAAWQVAVQTRVEALARWEGRIARALARGDLDLAAYSEECAAIVVHEVGLLDDGQFDLVGVHRVRPELRLITEHEAAIRALEHAGGPSRPD